MRPGATNPGLRPHPGFGSLERSLVCACAGPVASLLVAVQIRENVASLADSPSLDEFSDEPTPDSGSVALQLVTSGHGADGSFSVRHYLGADTCRRKRRTLPLLAPIYVTLHRRIEREVGCGEVRSPDEGEGVLGAVLAIHPGVLPFDRERSVVADAIERPEERFEVHVTVAGRHKVPTAGLVPEVQVRAEDGSATVEPLLRVLDVDVVDAIGELESELGGVQVLVGEVRGVEIDTECSSSVTAARAFSVVTKSYAISVGCTSRPNRTPSASNTSRIGDHASANAS